MNGYNRVILKGTTGADAEVRQLDGGNAVATMSIAINDSYTDKNSGERKTKTEWVRIEAWKGLANWLGQYGKKGTDFLVEGRIKTESYEKNGETRYSTKVVAEKILFTQPMSTNNTNGQPAQNQAQPQQQQPAQQPAQAQPQQQPAQPQPVQTAQQQTEGYVTSQDFSQGMSNGDDDLPF